MNNTIVKVENLSHRYNVQWAIQDISFEIEETGIMGLLGSNGAGKSTTMNIICGVLKQTAGKVFINGIDLAKNPVEAKKFIGFLPQHPPLYPDLTVNEYLTYCAKIRLMDKSRIKSAVEKAEEECKISHFKNRLIRNLSGGYQQRVGIAQAIVHEPKFVVLDEPTNGLDPNQIVEIRELVKQIARDRSVLLSTHILSEVEATCERIKMIEQGKVVFSGSMENFNNYILPDTFLVTLENPPQAEELKSIEGVKEIESLTANKFRIHFDVQPRITEKMVEISINRGWRLSEITIEKVSLDSIFAQLSGKNIK